MENLADRLKQSLNEKELTQSELARRVGSSQQAINHLLSGRTRRSRILPEIATALAVDLHWLIHGDNAKNIPVSSSQVESHGITNDFRIRGSADGLFEGVRLRRDKKDTVGFTAGKSDLTGTDAFAVYVNGGAMVPRFFNGEIVVCLPSKPAKIDDFVLLVDKDSLAVIRQLVEATHDTITVKTYIPEKIEMFSRSEVQGIYPIVAQWSA